MTVPMAPVPGWRGGDGNAAYLDKTLRHGPMEEYFDESVGWETIKGLWFKAVVCSLTALVAMVMLGALAGSVSAALSLGLLSAFIVFWVVILLSKLEEPIGEWRVVLADRSAASQSVYSAIRGKLKERRMPIQSIQSRRTYADAGAVNNRLILIDGHYQVYVSVFEYGTSLYLGWMMWRSRRGSVVVARFVSDLFASMTGRLDAVDLMLRTERPRAIREVVHALCREGLHVAVEQIEVPPSYGFPEGMPHIETLPASSAPTPSAPIPAQVAMPGDPTMRQ